MYEAKQRKEKVSRYIHLSEQKGKRFFVLANKRSDLTLKKNLLTNFINFHKPIQMKFSGNTSSLYWKDAIKYIGSENNVYKTLNEANEEFEIEEKNHDNTTSDDNRFSVVNDNKGKIEWNPRTKIEFGCEGEITKGYVSPAATLYHEMGHAVQWIEDKESYNELLIANMVKSPKNIMEPILDLHNLANNEMPFNIEHNEPIRYTYSAANIGDGVSANVTEHTRIENYSVELDNYLTQHYILNYKGLTLKEAEIWSKVDAGKIQEMNDLIALEPLIENNVYRKNYLLSKLKEIANTVYKYRRVEYINFFTQKENCDQYGAIKTLLESSGLLSI